MTVRGPGLLLGLFLLIFGLALASPLLLAAGFLFLLGAASAFVFERYGLRDVELRQRFEPERSAPGDEVTYTVEITNSGRLPLPFLRFEADWPEAVRSLRGNPFSKRKKGRMTLEVFVSVGRRERVRRRLTVVAQGRGHYSVREPSLRLSDPLGLTVTERIDSEDGGAPTLLVYPRLHPTRPPERLFRLGQTVRASSLLDDPLLVRHLRDWRPGDPLTAVDWRASARREEIVVRETEPAGRAEVNVFLNLDSARNAWEGVDPAYHESALELTGSLVKDLLERKVAVGLYANGVVTSPQGVKTLGVALQPANHFRQLEHVLTALAGLDPAAHFVDLTRILEREGRRRPEGTTFLLVTAFLSPELTRTLALCRRRGIRPIVIQAWDPEPGDAVAPPGVPILRPEEIWV